MFELPPRENLQYQLDEMSNGIEGDFFGEGEPNGAAFANFGILRSMQGLNGFDIVERHEVVSRWYASMQEHSGVYLLPLMPLWDSVMLTSLGRHLEERTQDLVM